MEEIEKATGKRIIRIETNDLDEMEEVCIPPFGNRRRSNLTPTLANEEGTKVDALRNDPQHIMYYPHTRLPTNQSMVCIINLTYSLDGVNLV